MAFKNSEAVGGGDYVQSSRGGNPKLEEPQDGASGLNVVEYLNPAAEQSSTPGAHAAAEPLPACPVALPFGFSRQQQDRHRLSFLHSYHCQIRNRRGRGLMK